MTHSLLRRIGVSAAALLFLFISACRSHHVDITVENQTGSPIQLLEIDYPNASFGADSLAAGADFHYRIQVSGSGPLKIQYTLPGDHQVKITGLGLAQGQQGTLQIILQPNAKADFRPQLTPAR